MTKEKTLTELSEVAVVSAAGYRVQPVRFGAPLATPDKQGSGHAPRCGVVSVRFDDSDKLPDEAKIFLTRHQYPRGKQHVLLVRTGKEVNFDLPPGEYTMQIQARGFEPHRSLIEVDPQRPATVSASLKPRDFKPRTFEERLAKYGVNASKEQLVDLNVAPRTVRALNHAGGCCDERGFRMLYADDIATVKRWVGSDDARFGHGRPVFGALPRDEAVPQLEGDVDHRTLSRDQVEAVTAIANEYVHGNSRAVAKHEALLNAAMKVTTRDLAAKLFPLFFYRVVTIGAGATLEVGNGSAIFTCDELRIHKTGTLKPVNSVTIEVGKYVEFT